MKLALEIEVRKTGDGNFEVVANGVRQVKREAEATTISVRSLAANLASIYGAVQSLRAVAGLGAIGIEFNETMRSSRIGIAAIVSSLGDLRDSQGKILEGQERFNEALKISTVIQRDLRKAGLETAATYAQLVRGLQEGAGPLLSANVVSNTAELTDFIKRTTLAATALQIPLEQIGQEIRGLISGEGSPDNRLANTLFAAEKNAGTMKKTIDELHKTHSFYAEFVKRTEAYNLAAAESQDLWSVTLSNFKDAVENALGEGTQGTYNSLVSLVKDLTKEILVFDEQGNATFNKEFIDNVTAVADVFVMLAKALGAVAKELPEVATYLRDIFDPSTGILPKTAFWGSLGAMVAGPPGALIAGGTAFLGSSYNAGRARGDASVQMAGDIRLSQVQQGQKYFDELQQRFLRETRSNYPFRVDSRENYFEKADIGLRLATSPAPVEQKYKALFDAGKDGVITLKEVNQALKLIEDTLQSGIAFGGKGKVETPFNEAYKRIKEITAEMEKLAQGFDKKDGAEKNRIAALLQSLADEKEVLEKAYKDPLAALRAAQKKDARADKTEDRERAQGLKLLEESRAEHEGIAESLSRQLELSKEGSAAGRLELEMAKETSDIRRAVLESAQREGEVRKIQLETERALAEERNKLGEKERTVDRTKGLTATEREEIKNYYRAQSKLKQDAIKEDQARELLEIQTNEAEKSRQFVEQWNAAVTERARQRFQITAAAIVKEFFEERKAAIRIRDLWAATFDEMRGLGRGLLDGLFAGGNIGDVFDRFVTGLQGRWGDFLGTFVDDWITALQEMASASAGDNPMTDTLKFTREDGSVRNVTPKQQRFAKGAMMGLEGAAALYGMYQSGQSGASRGSLMTTGALSGASMGAQLGGGYGAIIGAIVGAIAGGFMASGTKEASYNIRTGRYGTAVSGTGDPVKPADVRKVETDIRRSMAESRAAARGILEAVPKGVLEAIKDVKPDFSKLSSTTLIKGKESVSRLLTDFINVEVPKMVLAAYKPVFTAVLDEAGVSTARMSEVFKYLEDLDPKEAFAKLRDYIEVLFGFKEAIEFLGSSSSAKFDKADKTVNQKPIERMNEVNEAVKTLAAEWDELSHEEQVERAKKINDLVRERYQSELQYLAAIKSAMKSTFKSIDDQVFELSRFATDTAKELYRLRLERDALAAKGIDTMMLDDQIAKVERQAKAEDIEALLGRQRSLRDLLGQASTPDEIQMIVTEMQRNASTLFDMMGRTPEAAEQMVSMLGDIRALAELRFNALIDEIEASDRDLKDALQGAMQDLIDAISTVTTPTKDLPDDWTKPIKDLPIILEPVNNALADFGRAVVNATSALERPGGSGSTGGDSGSVPGSSRPINITVNVNGDAGPILRSVEVMVEGKVQRVATQITRAMGTRGY